MDVFDRLGLRDAQDVDQVPQIFGMLGELLAAKIGFGELERVDHRAHRAVEHEDSLCEQTVEKNLGFSLI